MEMTKNYNYKLLNFNNYNLNESKSTRETLIINNNNSCLNHAKHISIDDALNKFSVNSFNSNDSFSSNEINNSSFNYSNIIDNEDYYENPEKNYLNEIYNELLIEEKNNEFFQSFNYMNYQFELTPKIRANLINYLYKISQKFFFKDKTIYLSIQIIDRFLCKKKIDIYFLKLLGVSSLFISSKFNEIFYPEISNWMFYLKENYSTEQFLYMEYFILDSLNYNILPLYPLSFFEIINEKIKLNKYEFYLGLLIIEISQFEYNMIHFKSSIIVQSIVYLILLLKKRKNQKIDIDNIMLNIFPELKKNKKNIICINNCCKLISDLLDNINSEIFNIIYKKFSSKEYYNVTDFSVFM